VSIGHGLYRRADAEKAGPVDYDLLEIAHRARFATLCLASALVRHELTDANPEAIDVALPKGSHRPSVVPPVAWHMFDPRTFDIGRSMIPVDSETFIGIYSAERSIVDAFRMRHLEGDLPYVALRRWLRRSGSRPAALYDMTRHFPQARKSLKQALEVLLHD
jgi:predicted transcriptional regulator of viral defense system